jgi:hypothetical protein
MATSKKKVMQWYRLMFLTGSLCFSRPSSRVLRDSTHAVQVKCILLSKGQDVYFHKDLETYNGMMCQLFRF